MPLSYKWKRNGVYIPGELTNTYVVQVGDDTDTILCEVKGTNGIGSTLAYSNAVVIPDPKPSCTVNPIISGIPLEGQVLTVTSDGVWIGAPTITFSYQWRRNGVDIGGEVFNNYTLVAADAGCQIDCKVIGTNMYDSATAYSNYLIPSASLIPPTIVTPPSITGTGTIPGSVLTINDGVWTGSPVISYSRQWLRNGHPIIGETGTTYTLLVSDIDENIDCLFTATNPVTSIPYITYGITVESPPINIIPPAIIGNNTPGSILSLNLGTWEASPAITNYNYLWQFSTDGISWNNYSPSQINPTKTVLTSDIGRYIRCQLTAINSLGNGIAYSDSELIDSAPINTVPPVISIQSGTGGVGSVLQTTDGTWTGSGVITYSYRWLRNGSPIAGALSSTYTLVSADVGTNIQSEVTATNSIGPSIRTSNIIIPTSSPIQLQGPLIFGSYISGSTLYCQDGVYGGYPSSSITRKWQYSTDGGSTWIDYSPAQTGTTYLVQPTDNGRLIRILETASNGISPDIITASNSIEIASVGACGAVISGTPLVTGIGIVSQTLTCSIAGLTITGSPTPTVTFQWYDGLTMIPGASGTFVGTTTTYTLQASNSGNKVWCRVTASNVNGTSYADSNEISVFMTIADKYPGAWHSGWWPFLLRGAYYGQPLIRIRRESDNAEINISHDNNGYLNEALINSHCAGTIGRVVTVYDQFGTNNFTQGTPTSQPIIYTGGAIVKDNGIAVINNQTVSGQQLLVTGSAAAGTYTFMHNGLTPTYAVYCVSRSVNAVAGIIGTASTTTTTRGVFLLFTTTNTIRSSITNGTSNVMSITPTANTLQVPRTYVISMVNKPGNAVATLRGRIIANNIFIASNTSTAAPVTTPNTTTFDLNWGGSAIYQHMGALINQSETFATEIHEAIRQQFNITY